MSEPVAPAQPLVVVRGSKVWVDEAMTPGGVRAIVHVANPLYDSVYAPSVPELQQLIKDARRILKSMGVSELVIAREVPNG